MREKHTSDNIDTSRLRELHNGVTFNSYKDLCLFLNEEVLGGTSKTAQLKRWKQFFEYSRMGNKMRIETVNSSAIDSYEDNKSKINPLWEPRSRTISTPTTVPYATTEPSGILEESFNADCRPAQARQGKYIQYFEPFLLHALRQQESKSLILNNGEMSSLFLPNISSISARCEDSEKTSSLINNVNSLIVKAILDPLTRTPHKLIQNQLTSLANRNLIRWTRVYTYDTDECTNLIASSKDSKKIGLVRDEIAKDILSLPYVDTVSDIEQSIAAIGKVKEFYDKVASECKVRFKWKNVQKRYWIVLLDKTNSKLKQVKLPKDPNLYKANTWKVEQMIRIYTSSKFESIEKTFDTSDSMYPFFLNYYKHVKKEVMKDYTWPQAEIENIVSHFTEEQHCLRMQVFGARPIPPNTAFKTQ